MINRRQFLVGALGSSSLLGSVLSTPPIFAAGGKPLTLKIFATNWGFQGNIFEFCERVKQEGYDGIEVWLPEASKVKALQEALEANDLALILLAGAHETTFPENYATFQRNLERSLALSPVLVNCHTGRDYFSFSQGRRYFDLTAQYALQSGINIVHETHRSRLLFAAHICEQYLNEMPDLRINLDISHWCNVAASLLEDQKDAVNLALSRSDHIHSRVGFAHGPQVNDPRAPEWKKAFEAHVNWWDWVAQYKRKTTGYLTMTTEFGPFPYMPTLPYTKQAVADQWEINRYMMHFWRQRYSDAV